MLDYKGGMLEMDAAHFERCIKYISNKYTVVLVEDLNKLSVADARKPFATLTFDDGYKNNIDYAIPVLDKYKCKGSFYVVTDCVEKNLPVWIHLVEHLFLNTAVENIELQEAYLPASIKIATMPPKGNMRHAYFLKLRNWLKHSPVEQKDAIVNYLLEQIKDVEVEEQMMSWQDLGKLRSMGHYVGAHSHTHNALPFIANIDALRSEFEMPRDLIQQHLGYLPESFTYPFGFCNGRIRQMAIDSGYRIGLAAERHQIYDESKHDDFEIPRIALCNEPWWKTKMRITNKIENIKSLLPYHYKYRQF